MKANRRLDLCIGNHLSVSHDIRPRVTYSAKLEQLGPPAITDYIHSQLDHVGLPHHTFTEPALNGRPNTSHPTTRGVPAPPRTRLFTS